jgi:xylulokinase
LTTLQKGLTGGATSGHIIGIDVGSQSVKGILLSPDAETLGAASAACTMTNLAPGWADQAPSAWEHGIEQVVRQLISAAGLDPAAVSHLGLACQVDGVVPIDSSGAPLRDGIIWLDRRASGQAQLLADLVGADWMFSTTGLNADASHIAPKIMWLRDEEPETYKAAAVMAPVGGYLLGWLTGVIAQDHANASSTLLYDVRTRTWSDPMLEASGIDPSQLAEIRPSHEIAGPMRAAAAERLGLTTHCQVVVGSGDEHAASLGAGAALPGTVTDVTGTAEPVTAVAAELVFDEKRLVETHAHAVDGAYLVENPGFVSGGSTLWLSCTVLRSTQADLFDQAAAVPPGSEGVLFLPTLCGATAPRWNDRVRGVFAGLSLNHDRSHLARAVLEGCAFALRDIVQRLDEMGLGGPEIRVVGGGARSALWMQIKANVTAKPVRAVLTKEPTALGAAMLAGLGSGLFSDAEEAVARVVELASAPIEPEQGAVALYEEAYQRYLALFDAVEVALP